MVSRKSFPIAPCPLARAIDIVGDRWSLLLLRDAFDGVRRFSAFQKSMGVARNILSDRLKHLVAQGVLVTAPASDGTAYQEYVLTERGEALFTLMVALRQWGEVELFGPEDVHASLLDRVQGMPLAPLVVRSHDGRALTAWDAQVRTLDLDDAP